MKATILADLARARGWYCGAAWYASFRPTFSQRISEVNAEYRADLRSRGLRGVGQYLILSRVCHQEGHEHKSTIHEYALREFVKPEQLRMIA